MPQTKFQNFFKKLSNCLPGNFLDNILQDVGQNSKITTKNMFTIRNLTNALRARGNFHQVVSDVEKKAVKVVKTYGTSSPQPKVKRYPVFPLEETLNRFLCSTQPLLSKTDYKTVEEDVADFLEFDGASLQKILGKTAADEVNWLADRWMIAAYLRNREPVTVNSSPAMTLPLTQFVTDDDYLLYASKLVYCLIRNKEIIYRRELPVMRMGKNDLDNSQYRRLYGTCRIPRPKEDCLTYNPRSDYIVLIYKNNFYKFPVYNCEEIPLNPETMAKQMQRIYNKEKEPGIPFGLLTHDHRDNWAEVYKKLLRPKGNEKNLQVIQKSLFTLCLDDAVTFKDKKELIEHGRQLLHGGGTDVNGANRWMDKTIQVVVNRNGMSGIVFEHSAAEGEYIANICDYVVKNIDKKEIYEDSTDEDYLCPRRINIESTACVDLYIATAGRTLNKLADDLKLDILHYKLFGRKFLLKQRCNPDSFIQMVLQSVYYKLHKKPAAQYETAHLRIFQHGRTETIRSCSNESVAFAKAMNDKSVEPQSKLELLRTAVKKHKEYAKQAKLGHGCDRHLLGLKLMAIENDLPIPPIYETKGFVKTSHFHVSTMQVPTANHAFMCFGPSVPDGYGCCYNPRNGDIIFAVSSFYSSEAADAKRFTEALTDTLDKLHKMLTKYGEQSKTKKAKTMCADED